MTILKAFQANPGFGFSTACTGALLDAALALVAGSAFADAERERDGIGAACMTVLAVALALIRLCSVAEGADESALSDAEAADSPEKRLGDT